MIIYIFHDFFSIFINIDFKFQIINLFSIICDLGICKVIVQFVILSSSSQSILTKDVMICVYLT
jgi:hypothetical protein